MSYPFIQSTLISLAVELMYIVAIISIGLMIYNFIIRQWPTIRTDYRLKEQRKQEQHTLKELGTTRQKVYTKIYKKRQLDNITKATSTDLTTYLSEIYNREISLIDVFVDSIIQKKWTDSSLNCPNENGPNDDPVVLQSSEGWLIVWKFRDPNNQLRMFQYHATIDGEWVRCGEIDIPDDVHQSYKPTNN